MNKLLNYLFVFVVLSASVLGVCTYTSTGTGSDYFGINTQEYNESAMAVDELWTDWAFFTPRLNFTRIINESITGGVIGSYALSTWYVHDNKCNASLVVRNASSGVVVYATNYTFNYINATTGTFAIYWNVNTYNNTALYYTCNRTFTKNVDDITTPESTINFATTRADWLTENSPSDYGDSKLFKFDSNVYGTLVNVSNWAVGWNYTRADCTLGDTGCSAGASGLWSVLVLVVVAGFLLYLVGVFFEGSVTLSLIILVTIVALLLPWLISILNGGC